MCPIDPPIHYPPILIEDVRGELRIYAHQFPLAAKALAEIERLRAGLIEVLGSSDMQPCFHAKIAKRVLGL